MVKISKKFGAYTGMFFVVFVWGAAPMLMVYLNKVYSPVLRTCFIEALLLVTYLLMSGKNIKKFNMDYIKVGIPTGIFLALANLTQKIGLLYTTPSRYAFLENLSCVSVPVLMYILVKKKPSTTTVIASVMCLVSAFVLNGVSFNGGSWGIGEILCATSGILYGFNIAGTSVYAKKLYTPLYLATQSIMGFSVSLILTFVLNSTYITTSSGLSGPVEKIMFSFKPSDIILLVLCALVVNAFCWVIRTYSMKYIDACVVAIIMPFSAVITSVLSVIMGSDTLNSNLVIGGILGLVAIFLSGVEDGFSKKTRSEEVYEIKEESYEVE